MNTTGFNTSFGHNHQFNILGNSQGSDRKNQQYKKILCAYHSTQFLTNFCIDKSCLMPLCPTCVVEHTQQHYECNQKPAYVNLNDALQDSKQKCYSNIIKLQEFNRKNIEISNYIQGLPDYIRKQLVQCKDKLYRFIDQTFESFETQIIEQIRQKYEEDAVYNRKECEEVRQFISTQIDSLYDKIGQLKGEQCLSALIRYYESDEKNLQMQMNEIVDYIQKNKRAGGLYITLNAEELTRNYSNICEQLIALQYVNLDQSKSFNSTKNLDPPHNSNKKSMGNSNANKVSQANNNNRSNVKQKSGVKSMAGFSSKKHQDKNYYPSPYKNTNF